MLERFLEQQPALCAVLLDSSERDHWCYLPEGRECNVLEELLTVLKPFVQATTLMSGSKYPTVGIISPLLYKLFQNTLSVTYNDSPTMKNIKGAISEDLKHRYQNKTLQLLFKKCAYLDPRFKDLDPFVAEDERCMSSNL